MSARKLSKEDLSRILGQSQAPAKALAGQYGVTVRRIQQLRQANGQQSARLVTPDERTRIIRLRERGLSLTTISASTGRAMSTVRLVLAAR